MAIGTLTISDGWLSPHERQRGAVARATLFGPRGGHIANVLINTENAQQVIKDLRNAPGVEPASILDDMQDNARRALEHIDAGNIDAARNILRSMEV